MCWSCASPTSTGMSHLRSFLQMQTESADLRWGLRFCISNKTLDSVTGWQHLWDSLPQDHVAIQKSWHFACPSHSLYLTPLANPTQIHPSLWTSVPLADLCPLNKGLYSVYQNPTSSKHSGLAPHLSFWAGGLPPVLQSFQVTYTGWEGAMSQALPLDPTDSANSFFIPQGSCTHSPLPCSWV